MAMARMIVVDGQVIEAAICEDFLAACPVRSDQLASPPEREPIDMSDHDQHAIAGTLEGLGYL